MGVDTIDFSDVVMPDTAVTARSNQPAPCGDGMPCHRRSSRSWLCNRFHFSIALAVLCVVSQSFASASPAFLTLRRMICQHRRFSSKEIKVILDTICNTPINPKLAAEYEHVKSSVEGVAKMAKVLVVLEDPDTSVALSSEVAEFIPRVNELSNSYLRVRLQLWQVVELERSLLETLIKEEFINSVAQMHKEKIQIYLRALTEDQRLLTTKFGVLQQSEMNVASRVKGLRDDANLTRVSMQERHKKVQDDLSWYESWSAWWHWLLKLFAHLLGRFSKEEAEVLNISLQHDIMDLGNLTKALNFIYEEIKDRQVAYEAWINRTSDLAGSAGAAASSEFQELAHCLSELSITIRAVIHDVLIPIIDEYRRKALESIIEQDIVHFEPVGPAELP